MNKVFLPAMGSVVALGVQHTLVQQCGGPCRGCCGAARAAGGVWFDPGQREQCCTP